MEDASGTDHVRCGDRAGSSGSVLTRIINFPCYLSPAFCRWNWHPHSRAHWKGIDIGISPNYSARIQDRAATYLHIVANQGSDFLASALNLSVRSMDTDKAVYPISHLR